MEYCELCGKQFEQTRTQLKPICKECEIKYKNSVTLSATIGGLLGGGPLGALGGLLLGKSISNHKINKNTMGVKSKNNFNPESLNTTKPITKELKFSKVLNINASKQKKIYSLMIKQLKEFELEVTQSKYPSYIEIHQKILGGFDISIVIKLSEYKGKIMITKMEKINNFLRGYTEKGLYDGQKNFESLCIKLEQDFGVKNTIKDTKFCFKCGKQIEKVAKFCPECGVEQVIHGTK